jgi:hypothetical protein
MLAFSGGCAAALGPVEPLSTAELDQPMPTRPSLMVPFSDADADPREDMSVDQRFFRSQVVERDHGTFSYSRAPIWAPATRDRSGDRELAQRIEAPLAALRWGDAPARSAVWTGERLIALFYGGRRGTDADRTDWVTVVAVFAPGVPEPTAMPEHAWRLHVEHGPFVLGDGRLLFSANEPFGQRVDALRREEPLELPRRPAVLTFDPAQGVRVVAELDLDYLEIDTHDRIWGVIDGKHPRMSNRWLIGLRVDGRPFFSVELEGFGHGWIDTLDLTADGPCISVSPDGHELTRCFGLDGRRRNEGR